MTGPRAARGRRVVVIGGTGAVGREVVALLADERTDVVVVARDAERARAVATSMGLRRRGPVTVRRADVRDPSARRAAVDGASVVVTCVEQANTELAMAARTHGAHLVDVSASPHVLAAIGRLDGLARANRTTAVVGVGLAPGLTNLLVRACVDRVPEATGVDIAVLVGLGERHGVEAIRWVLDGLAAPTGPDSATARPSKVVLPGFGTRSAHPFPFADQHLLTQRLGIRVTTRLCFARRAVTAVAFALRRSRVLARLPRPALARALARVHVGSDRFAIAVTATDADGHRATATGAGRQQSHASAVVAAHAVRNALEGALAPGVRHIDEVLDVDEALAVVESAGIAIQRPIVSRTSPGSHPGSRAPAPAR
jgi:Saccharopine dehydrogenase NADP binding domain